MKISFELEEDNHEHEKLSNDEIEEAVIDALTTGFRTVPEAIKNLEIGEPVYVIQAVDNHGKGFRRTIGRYHSLEDIRIKAGVLSKDDIVEIYLEAELLH